MRTRYKYETEFRVGQEVILWPDFKLDLPKIVTVESVNGSFVVAGGKKYNLRGREWGRGDSWHYDRITIATPEERERMQEQIEGRQEEIRRIRAAQTIRNFNTGKHTTEQLERVAAVIEEVQDGK